MEAKILIGSDHAGFVLKEEILLFLKQKMFEVQDVGSYDETSVDYPDFANELCNILKKDENTYGILICGSGVGMSIAANRYDHIRAALCTTPLMAELARNHNNANVLVLSSRLVDIETNKKIVEIFLKSAFEGGRHISRLNKIRSDHNGDA